MDDFKLDRHILQFVTDDFAPYEWTIRNAVEGVQIFGGIGSGKTSGSGKSIALAYLNAGFGGLVLTVKPDEKDSWLSYCKKAGREKDVIVVEPSGNYFFNFMEYESRFQNGDRNYTENLVHILKTVIQASAEKDHGKSNDPFWDNALDILISNSIDLCQLAFGEITIGNLYKIVQGAPVAQLLPKGSKTFQFIYNSAKKNVNSQVNEWRSKQTEETNERLTHDDDFFEEKTCAAIPDAQTFNFISTFFEETYSSLNDRTRSIIDFSFSSFLLRLLKEPVYSLFCKNKSNFDPENCLDGKIIIINLPVKTYNKVGRDCQILFKYIWQRAMERRRITINKRPVFLWADESQNFLHEYDAEYQATARSSRIATVYISQNLPNYYAQLGGQDKAVFKVKSFLGTLSTKIFHANADIDTNKYASELIGDAYRKKLSITTSVTDGKATRSECETKEIERRIKPEAFASLLTGGPANAFAVSAYIHKQGDAFSDGRNFQLTHFNQTH